MYQFWFAQSLLRTVGAGVTANGDVTRQFADSG